jgi:hypothetical protein
MASRPAPTVASYLSELPPERRKVMAALRTLIRANLPKGYKEGMGLGMLMYAVPLSVLPNTYNGHPLLYVAAAANKNGYSLYLMTVYGDAKQAAWLKGEFKAAGKKLDMGKSCIRFKSLDDLPLDAIASVVRSVPMDQYVAMYKRVKGL